MEKRFKILWVLVPVVLLLLSGCAPQAQYKSHRGKKKLKSYNMHMNDNYRSQKNDLKIMKKKTKNH